ncbi:hypothetical protein XA68_13339 [Ophiocordyceps unilateralis]|uniref:DNA polymerase V n=1 Tax=Ophiocordyceps unilateralis TaxID=268505 RepID=A0A2A9PCR5_OPHUN|nr:hypothetical protein XA68_13339 [Ophiocordyceps unilateralis]
MAGKRKRGAANSGPVASKRAKNASEASATSLPGKLSLEPLPFAETPNPDDRKREAALYELLGSEDEAERIAAADSIVSSLLKGQGAPEAVLQRHLDRRLFRGLASGRNASRLGFSLVITEILGQLYGPDARLRSRYGSLTFETVLALLVDKTQAGGKISGQEERDHYFGQLFGIECFVRSRILFCDASRWDRVLELLLKLGSKKSWLRPQCAWILVQAMEQMDREQTEKSLLQLDQAGMAKTAEGVAAWLVALERHPTLRLKPWRNPLSAKSLDDLAAVLKESFKASTKDSEDKAQVNGHQAGWSAQLHFAWDVILAHFAKGNAGAGLDALTLFWNRVVDDGLFSKNATDGQKFKGFMVFQKMLQGLADQHDKLRCLFSKNLMMCLMNQAAKEDRYLHRAAIKALKTIESVVHSHPSTLVPVLENLIGKNGVYNFDQRTSTKVVDKLLQNINGESAEGCLATIRQPMASLVRREEDEAKLTLRLYAGYLSKVLNAFASDSSTMPPYDANRGSTYGPVLQELAGLAYGNPKNVPQGALTEQFRDICRSHIESSLARLTQRAHDFDTFCYAVASINPASRTMSDEISSAVDAALSRMKKLLRRKSSEDDKKSLARGLAMLHAVSVFQLYNESPDAMEVLDDLAQFYDRFKKGGGGDGSEGTSELLVEILLSMVARPSSLMRQISHRVFDAFSGQISAQGLALLTTPLASDESSKGEKELFDTAGDEMDEEASESGSDDSCSRDSGSDVEMDSDVEILNLKNGAAAGDDDDEEEEGGDKQPQLDGEDLDVLVGNILKSHRLDKDGEAESSSSDGNMSDSEMLALDEKLAEVFKQQTKARPDTKKQKREARQSVVNFKHRILDLLDTYVRNEALNPLAMTLLVPLLRLMRTTSTKSLAGRACEILLHYQRCFKKARAGSKAVVTGGMPSAGQVVALLEEVHGEAGKDKSHAYAKAASAASLTLVSVVFGADRQAVKEVATVYARTQADWVLGNVQLQSSFFADWNNWCQNQASQARP